MGHERLHGPPPVLFRVVDNAFVCACSRYGTALRRRVRCPGSCRRIWLRRDVPQVPKLWLANIQGSERDLVDASPKSAMSSMRPGFIKVTSDNFRRRYRITSRLVDDGRNRHEAVRMLRGYHGQGSTVAGNAASASWAARMWMLRNVPRSRRSRSRVTMISASAPSAQART